MKPLSADELLSIWERGRELSLLRRTLLLLEVACSDSGKGDVAAFSIGERDARLFKLREWMFGSLFLNSINCPECSEHMEWEMQMNDLNMLPKDFSEIPNEHSLKSGGYTIRFRLPNSKDISEILLAEGSVYDQGILLKKCITEIKPNKGKSPVKKLSAKLMDELSSKMEELDPEADIRLNITCPNCSHQWEAHFDIMSYLWDEIDSWAQRLLRDVYLLASAFGWSEKEILNMDAGRRQLYVEMVST